MSINLTDEIEVKTKKGKLGAAKQIFLEGDTTSLQKEHEDNQAHFDTLDNRSAQMEETIKSIAATGGASQATAVTYNNDASRLNAVNAQAAIDEVSSIAHFAKRGAGINISTNYNSDHIVEVLTLSQALSKVPRTDRVLGFQGKYLASDGWHTIIYIGNSLTDWGDTTKWTDLADKVFNSISNNATFAGIATPTTDPEIPDGPVFYIANGKGTYTNFGGLEVTEDEVAILYWDSSWHKVSTGIASQAKLSELSGEINNVNVSIGEYENQEGYYIIENGKVRFFQDNPNNKNVRFRVQQGKQVYIKSAIGGNSVRQWLFIADDLTIISMAEPNSSAAVLLNVPVGATQMIVQTTTASSYVVVEYGANLRITAIEDKNKSLDERISVAEKDATHAVFMFGDYEKTNTKYIYDANTNSVSKELNAITDESTLIKVQEGDTVTILSAKGGNSLRQWICLDKDQNIVDVADTFSESSVTLTIPQGASFLVVQTTDKENYPVKISFGNVGNPQTLNTKDKSTIVGALNELHNKLANGVFSLEGHISESTECCVATEVGKSATFTPSDDNNKAKKIDVVEGLSIYIEQAKGGNSIRQWVFLDDANNVVALSEPNSSNKCILNAPINSSVLYVQTIQGDDIIVRVGLNSLYEEIYAESGIKNSLSIENVSDINDSAYAHLVESFDAEQILCPNLSLETNPYVIDVKSQEDFERVRELLNNAISSGQQNILLNLSATKLYFNEKHLNLTEENYPNASNVNLIISGLPCTQLIAKGNEYKLENTTKLTGNRYSLPHNESFDYRHLYLSDEEDIDIFSPVKFAESKVSVVGNNQDKYFKIKLSHEDKNTNAKNMVFTAGWVSFYVEIDRIDDSGYAYFYCTSSRNSWLGNYYMVSYDNIPRYRLYNSSEQTITINNGEISILRKYANVYETSVTTFLLLGNAFKSVEVSNLNFIGNSSKLSTDFVIYDYEDALIYINQHKVGYINVHDCCFRNIKSYIISSFGSENIMCKKNHAEHCYRGLFYSKYNDKSVFVVENYAKNMGLLCTNDNVICCEGNNFLISGNNIVDFNYCAIRTGTDRDSYTSKGIIENNEVGFSPEYSASSWKYTLTDSGAIYTYDKHELVIIRDNIVYNYMTWGVNNGRAIYLDGHSSNVKVYRNIIINTGDGEDIVCLGGGEANQSKGNLIIYNVITSRYTITNCNGDCIKGVNFVFAVNSLRHLNNVENANYNESDYIFYGAVIHQNYIAIPYTYSSLLSVLPILPKQKYRILANL